MNEVTRLLEDGKPRAALEEMARVVLADPAYAEAYNDLAVLEYSNGRLADAQWAVERSLALDASSPIAKETKATIEAPARETRRRRARAPRLTTRRCYLRSRVTSRKTRLRKRSRSSSQDRRRSSACWR